MNRRLALLFLLGAVACVLGCPSIAAASRPAIAGGGAVVAHAAQAPLSGTIVAIEADDFTIQTGGRRTGLVDALIDAANAVTAQDVPYVWGGGHAEAGVASTGDLGGPGANGHTLGYDCSGAVAAVLAYAGLWRVGSAVPNDAGVIAQLLSEGVIAPGAGAPPDEVTIYDRPGVHIFMNVDGRFFGTSDGGGGGNPNGGAGWLDDAATDAYDPAFKQYHIVPSVLADETTYGQDYTFQTLADPALDDGFLVGDQVNVGYSPSAGAMDATALSWVGQTILTATVKAVSPSAAQLVVETAAGRVMTMEAADVESQLDMLEAGDTVSLIYTRSRSSLVLHQLTLTAVPVPVPAPAPAPAPVPVPAPVPETATGTVTAIAANGASFTITTRRGARIVLPTGNVPGMLTGVTAGMTVQVTYTKAADKVITVSQVSPVETSSPATDAGAPAVASG